ncbi:methyltransferase domain-containing protein [Rhodocytophaga aerolata]|uniref:Methyltransferase domain-containing protein n=1 Tax=Rhodocytophaga aerolata TaxID=455078 RepID=A0ABT8R9S0_9BACT|nr:methyltransferase domain-containing protein [Rhodocytophaga aerolata]MDO1448836.1 methyltransferase domain-containing protein [Rhodocytophaga aerolata]
MNKIKSPLTGSLNTTLERYINSKYIIEGYKKYLNIDVTRFFETQNKVSIYRCNDTGFRFYYPFDIDGDPNFYKDLQKIDWYYSDWRWENEIANNLINPTDKVLEIGCGKGVFLERLTKRGIECLGLELNDDTVAIGELNNITILNENIEDHANLNPSTYDWIVTFQVVEHIAFVKSFIEASLKALKPGGKLIISVPNNDAIYFSFHKEIELELAFQQRILLMNMPPHHMGLWNSSSLSKLDLVFNLNVEKIYKEPFPEHRIDLVSEIFAKKYMGFNNYLIRKIFKSIIYRFKKTVNLEGTTVLAVYSKPF